MSVPPIPSEGSDSAAEGLNPRAPEGIRKGQGAEGTVNIEHDHHELSFIRKYIFSVDHKMIGLQFMFTGLVLMGLGGALAMAIRWQLAWPWTEVPVIGELLFPMTGGAMSPEFYTMLFTMHGTIMIFFVIIPMLTGAFGNFLIPLMIGAPDMAFPRLNMIGYWAMVPGLMCALASFFVEGGGQGLGDEAVGGLECLEAFSVCLVLQKVLVFLDLPVSGRAFEDGKGQEIFFLGGFFGGTVREPFGNAGPAAVHFLAGQLGLFFRGVVDETFAGQGQGDGERIVGIQLFLRLFRFVFFVHRTWVFKRRKYNSP